VCFSYPEKVSIRSEKERTEAVTIVETMPEMRNHIVLFQFLVRCQGDESDESDRIDILKAVLLFFGDWNHGIWIDFP
jgi:hypothetical protein